MKKLIFIAGLMLFLGMAVMAQAATVTYTGNYAVVTGWSGTWDQANLDLAERLGKSWTLAVITGASEQGFVAASIAGKEMNFGLVDCKILWTPKMQTKIGLG